MKKNITCLCGSSFSIETEEEFDLDQEPQTLEKIFYGTFMSYDCPYCGKKHKPEYRIMLSWKSKNLKMEVIPELDRGEFYRNKKAVTQAETVIGFPEMADRLAVIKDSLEPIVIETLKSYLLAKAEENYPDNDINVWYHAKGPSGIEFHLDGIRADEVAVMRIPQEMYDKTYDDYKKHPKKDIFTSLRVRSYLSVQNILRHEALK
jgi:hypothetical protein